EGTVRDLPEWGEVSCGFGPGVRGLHPGLYFCWHHLPETGDVPTPVLKNRARGGVFGTPGRSGGPLPPPTATRWLLLVDDDHFQLGHLFNGVARPLLAQAAVLQSAVRHQVRAPLRAPVDVNVPGLDGLGELERPVDVLGKQGGAQAVFGVV